MKAFWRIVGIGMLVAVLGSMTLGIVSAKDLLPKGVADKVDSSDTTKWEKDGEKSFDRSKELWRAPSRLLVEVAAEELGMSARELWGELKGGATIAGLADGQGVDLQALHDAYMFRLTAWLGQAVAEGSISQSDSDGLLAKMQCLGLDLWTSGKSK